MKTNFLIMITVILASVNTMAAQISTTDASLIKQANDLEMRAASLAITASEALEERDAEMYEDDTLSSAAITQMKKESKQIARHISKQAAAVHSCKEDSACLIKAYRAQIAYFGNVISQGSRQATLGSILFNEN